MVKVKRRSRYRSVGDRHLIEVRVKSALQLFDARDPAPFRDRDLDDDFLEYVLASAEEFPLQTKLKIIIYVQETIESLEKDSIKEAITAHFAYQEDLKRKQLSKLFKTSQFYLLIGLVGLFACLSLSNFIANRSAYEGSEALKITREGLVILGWVAMWKPFEIVLFDWLPLFDRLRLFRKLQETEIEIVFDKA